MTVIGQQKEIKASQQRLVFPPRRRRNSVGTLLRSLRALSPSVRGVALPVGTSRTVQCPQRGEVPVEACADCPLLIKLTSRKGQASVRCCVPREAFSAGLSPSDRYLSGRMGFR